MPLHAEHVMVWRGSFDAFDYRVLWASGRDAQTVSGDGDRLMMAGVDPDADKVIFSYK
jgi:hypothetical protein